MKILLQSIKPNDQNLTRYIVRQAAQELSNLSEPCYYSKTKKFYFDIINHLGISNEEFKRFVKRNYSGTKAETWKLWNDPASNVLIFLMHYFLTKNLVKEYMATMVYYMIVHYSRLMHKQIAYCDQDAFKFTLDNLTKTHLFYREKTIPNSLYFLSNEMIKRFTNDFKSWNLDNIIMFISVSRHRISQSIKSFAEHYYANRKDGRIIKTHIEEPDSDKANMYQYQVQERGQKVIDQALNKIIVYKVIDQKAFNDAKNFTKIKTSIATLIVNGLSNDIHLNSIKIALQLYIKDIKDVSTICNHNKYYDHVKKMMAIKRSSATLFFKSQINSILMSILSDIKMVDTYKGYTQQTQFIINSFLAFYLTSIIKNSICSS